MARRIYPNPPIVEAVIEFRFSSDVTAEELLKAVRASIGDRYSGPGRQQTRLEVTVDAGAGSAKTRQSLDVTFLTSWDGRRVLGCGHGMLSVHVLAPYPGWESFLEQAKEATAALPDELRRKDVHSISVRYIDRIVLPQPGEWKIPDFFLTMPACPASMPQQLTGFHVATQSHDPASSTSVSLTLTSGPAHTDGRPVVFLDVAAVRSSPESMDLASERWTSLAEHLHSTQGAIFEESVTERCKELFQ